MLDKRRALKIDEVERWLYRNRRFRFHFVPAGSSWVDMVEEWFTQGEEKTLYRGSFTSVSALKAFVAASNDHAEPRVWTKDVHTPPQESGSGLPPNGTPAVNLESANQ